MTARVSSAMYEAIQLIKNEGLNPSQAALRVGLHPSTVIRSKLYRQYKSEQELGATGESSDDAAALPREDT